jgi:hypothetical protein
MVEGHFEVQKKQTSAWLASNAKHFNVLPRRLLALRTIAGTWRESSVKLSGSSDMRQTLP